MTDFRIKRVYEPAAETDGYRVLVDRLWPRGMSHAKIHCDEWDKNLAPSTGLREWFHQDPTGRFDDFARRYAAELAAAGQPADFARRMQTHPVVTLLYGSHDPVRNNAAVLQRLLEAQKG